MDFLKFLGILLLGAIVAIGIGFLTINNGNDAEGHKIIGLSTLFIFFIIMPLFIWTRYRKKDLSKFNFNQKKEDDDDDDDWGMNDRSRLN
jgi:high-affinity Fe2+/Pb2+ permease